MSVSTTRFFDNNSALFSKINDELKSLQGQVGTGEAELKLGKNIGDISKLSAADEKKSETNQFLSNSKRAQSDLEFLDVAFDRLQNLLIRVQELAVESANDTLLPEERQQFVLEAQMVKLEILDVANQKDTFGNNLFGGVSGVEKPFEINSKGEVNYLGSSLAKELQVTQGLAVKQNFSGLDVFDNIQDQDGAFSVFEVVDDLIASLEIDLNSNVSSNIFKNTSSAVIQLPSTGPEGRLAFSLNIDATEIDIDQTFYGNDFSELVNTINSSTADTGLSASLLGDNQIFLEGDVSNLFINKFQHFGNDEAQASIKVLEEKNGALLQSISENALQSSKITGRITDVFEHFAGKRAEVSANSRRAQDSEIALQDFLITLEEDISEIRDADLAGIITQLEFLMTQKDAAQATFTRITGKSLFDLIG
ncbi:flagellar hook-associated protein FlgL [Rhodobacteraceae bacterium]|nr:flagellar hook-associated protein FlgL [Paracoccaceae bacterium]